jgi:hypothetical protein
MDGMVFRRPLPIAVGLAITMAAALYGWATMRLPEEGARLSARDDAGVRGGMPEDVRPVVTASSAATVGAARTRVTHAEQMAAAMSSSDPYAIAIRLHAERRPGSFAIAREIDSLCRRSLQEVVAIQRLREGIQMPSPGKGLPVADSALPPELRVQRAAAMQEINARCSPFADDPTTAMPRPDDPLGAAFMQAVDSLQGYILHRFLKGSVVPKVADPFPEIVRQGMAWSQWDHLASKWTGFGHFEGKLSGGLTDDEFKHAVELGALIATHDESGGRPDLRVLVACAYSARCEGGLDQAVLGDLSMDTESKLRIKSMAERVAIELRTNEVEPFRAKPSMMEGSER